jgi:hypothetical protein
MYSIFTPNKNIDENHKSHEQGTDPKAPHPVINDVR